MDSRRGSASTTDGHSTLMQTICTEQNSDLQLDRLAAQRALYAVSKSVFGWHAFLSTVAAGMISGLALFVPQIRPYAALWGGLLPVLDLLWLTPWQKRLRDTAARVQESFDCHVLGLRLQPIKTGKAVEHETITEYANRYRLVEPTFASLRNWYPAEVCSMPLFLARVVCQRINPWWEAKQRRLYAFVLIAAVVTLLLMLTLAGVARSTPLPDLLLTMAPLMSAIVFALRQHKENSEAADRLEKLKEHADALWIRALAGATEDELMADCRALQDELFDHRKRTVPVFDRLYGRLRPAQEFQMHENAAQRVRELKTARADATSDSHGARVAGEAQ